MRKEKIDRMIEDLSDGMFSKIKVTMEDGLPVKMEGPIDTLTTLVHLAIASSNYTLKKFNIKVESKSGIVRFFVYYTTKQYCFCYLNFSLK